jgi:hypothetical protein
MSLDDGQAAYESLALACNTCQSASQGPNDMPAYAARLLAHLNQRIRNAPPPTKPTEPPRMTSNPEGGFETLLELQAQLNVRIIHESTCCLSIFLAKRADARRDAPFA